MEESGRVREVFGRRRRRVPGGDPILTVIIIILMSRLHYRVYQDIKEF